jgi:hypothetical protein
LREALVRNDTIDGHRQIVAYEAQCAVLEIGSSGAFVPRRGPCEAAQDGRNGSLTVPGLLRTP